MSRATRSRFLLTLRRAATITTVLIASPALAAPGDDDLAPGFSLGIGYTALNFEQDSDLIDDHDGVHFDPYLSFSPFPAVQQLRLGAGFGVSVTVGDTRGAAVSGGGGLVVVGEGDVQLVLFEPELRLAWRQPLGAAEMVFVEAGGAVGATFGWLDVDEDDDATADGDDSFNEHAGSPHYRGFVRVGGYVPGGIVGVEASYLRATDLDFADDVGGEMEQVYVGVFGMLQF